jgi:predicted small secreted protein
MARAFTVALSLALALSLGCNTVEGFGKDLRKLGGSIERSADRTDD